jgi:hypothetical protein
LHDAFAAAIERWPVEGEPADQPQVPEAVKDKGLDATSDLQLLERFGEQTICEPARAGRSWCNIGAARQRKYINTEAPSGGRGFLLASSDTARHGVDQSYTSRRCPMRMIVTSTSVSITEEITR